MKFDATKIWYYLRLRRQSGEVFDRHVIEHAKDNDRRLAPWWLKSSPQLLRTGRRKKKKKVTPPCGLNEYYSIQYLHCYSVAVMVCFNNANSARKDRQGQKYCRETVGYLGSKLVSCIISQIRNTTNISCQWQTLDMMQFVCCALYLMRTNCTNFL